MYLLKVWLVRSVHSVRYCESTQYSVVSETELIVACWDDTEIHAAADQCLDEENKV